MNRLDFQRKKEHREKISMVTCYDYPSACIVNESKIDCVLVGDSVAMTVHGHQSTIMATMEMMEMHTAAVARGLEHPFLISDLPFLAHRSSNEYTMECVKRLMQAGAEAIKIEGGDKTTCRTIEWITQAGIPVMGHIGLTPQSIHQLGGFKVQGKAPEQVEQLLQQAQALQEAGCFAIVIECVPSNVAFDITNQLTIPTIGIGAGVGTDGQVLVWHDLLGLNTDLKLRFVKQFATAKHTILNALDQYAQEVHDVRFPTIEHAF